MRPYAIKAVLGAMLALGLSGCNKYLTGPKLGTDPNDPTTASNGALFVSSEVNFNAQLESRLARSVCIWMQQCGGQSQYLALGTYSVAEDDYYINWSSFYGGGGLIDLKTIESRSLATSDSIFWGQATVLEALFMGTTADLWGDIPYSEAANPSFPRPHLDPQQTVYTALQARLDTAIIFLAATGPTNKGAGDNDLVYAGDPAKWTELAHTLKARFYMHVARRDATAYANAAAEAAQGIQPGDDFELALSGNGPTSSNFWSVFQSIFPGYVVAGFYLDSVMVADSDPRLPLYFATNANGDYQGGKPGVADAPSNLSTLSSTRLDGAFPQPFVTWAETQLILAEATYQTDNTDAGGTARGALQAVWNSVGITRTAPTPGTPGPTDSLMNAIMMEKYISLFQNVETWSDWKRTGIPNIQPPPGFQIPRRLTYPLSERDANPNIPGPGPARNWNDP
ncbi:MAG TPA: SusD/RagB family nutrient-binding outer membrane lipoprotein [Gemmatimonadales bacterium]|nr:SusD/RagB family nutrient-binding outer membrane lipoprotein [Gemmatimonadales bacterium]